MILMLVKLIFHVFDSVFMKDVVMKKIPNKILNEIIALYCDYAGDHTKVSSLADNPVGMVGKLIPNGKFAL
jgi:hypothetical protein